MANDGRVEFERVISRPPYMCSVRRMDDTVGAEYIATDVQLAWEMFQVGRSQVEREIYPVFDRLDSLLSAGYTIANRDIGWCLYGPQNILACHGLSFRGLCVNIGVAGL